MVSKFGADVKHELNVDRDEVSPLVTGVSHAVYAKCTSKEEALQTYLLAYLQGDVIRRL